MLHIQRSQLLPSAVPEYLLRHQPSRVWPDLIDAVRMAGFTRYMIARDGEHLFSAVEVDDPIRAANVLADSPAASRWLDSLAPLMDVEDAHHPWRALDTVFDLSWPEFR